MYFSGLLQLVFLLLEELLGLEAEMSKSSNLDFFFFFGGAHSRREDPQESLRAIYISRIQTTVKYI